MSEEIGVVLIHGAGLNADIWDEFLKYLDHPYLVVNFPNRQNGAANSGLSFEEYVKSTKEQIIAWGNENFIIVGHSLGACIGLALLESMGMNIKGFVAIASIVPKSGNSFVQSLPFPQNLLMPIILKLAGTIPPKKVIEKELCNDLNTAQTDMIVNGFVAESIKLYTGKITYSIATIESLYIKLEKDASMPVSLQDKMITNLHPTEVKTLDSGHLPMISQPENLASIIQQFAKRVEQKTSEQI